MVENARDGKSASSGSRRSSRAPGAAPPPRLVDVIVATRDRPDDLRRMLPTILAQSHRDFRLMIVDQSDAPARNEDLVRAFADPRVEHLVHRDRGKSKALNEALRRTSASIVAFTDDDCTVPPDWLASAVAALDRSPTAGIVFGSVFPARHDVAEWFIPSIEIEEYRVVSGPLIRSPGLLGMGANMIIRRSLFERIGLFDEDLGPGGLLFTGEECEITYRALRHGIDVARDPSLHLVHHGARSVARGQAKATVNTAFFAVGAGYGKHLRAGDARALSVVCHQTATSFWGLLNAAARGRRPLHIRRLRMFWKGVVAGLERGPQAPVASPTAEAQPVATSPAAVRSRTG